MATLFCNIFFLILGALNTVGRYIVNMTRGGQEASITNNNPSQNVPDAILTLTKNVLGQNVTRTIEPMIKRIGVVETRDDPTLLSTVAPLASSSPIAEASPLNATQATFQSVDAKKKKTKKQKTKRKDSSTPAPEQQQTSAPVEAFTENSKRTRFNFKIKWSMLHKSINNALLSQRSVIYWMCG